MTHRTWLAAVVLALALGTGACDSGPVSTPLPTVSKPALPPVPTPAELDATLHTALDPTVPAAAKSDLVQGMQADPNLINQLAQSFTSAGASAVVTTVDVDGDTLHAGIDLTLAGKVTSGTVPFVAEDGKWKIANSWACAKIATLMITSPACPSRSSAPTTPGR